MVVFEMRRTSPNHLLYKEALGKKKKISHIIELKPCPDTISSST